MPVRRKSTPPALFPCAFFELAESPHAASAPPEASTPAPAMAYVSSLLRSIATFSSYQVIQGERGAPEGVRHRDAGRRPTSRSRGGGPVLPRPSRISWVRG